MAHLKPLPKNLHAALEPKFDHYQATRGFIPNSILTMQRRPEIAKAFMQMNQVILYEGTVSEELKMVNVENFSVKKVLCPILKIKLV